LVFALVFAVAAVIAAVDGGADCLKRNPWVPAFAVLMVAGALEFFAVFVLLRIGDSILEGIAYLAAMLAGVFSVSCARRVMDDGPARPCYGRIELEGLE
jgi:hypothetical protein